MARWKREIVGDVLADKDDKTKSYIKVSNDVTLKSGDYLNLESKKDQLDGITKAFENGKLPEEIFEKAKARIENIPDFVRFTIVKISKND